jgi:glucosamine--fructose-6-phosphate aminotransferase (isomerizing)
VTSNIAVIRGPYFHDIFDQPRALRATWEALQRSSALAEIERLVAKQKFERIVLTGMGSSYFSLHPLAIEVAEHGWTPVLLETSELIHCYPDLLTATTLAVAVSQSGRSAETLRVLEQKTDRPTIIAVTNAPESPLAQRADFTMLTDAGQEATVSCKTYVSALMALSVLGAALCGEERRARLQQFETAAHAVETYLRDWEKRVEAFCESLRAVTDIFLTGRGSSLAAVGTGALTTKESAHFHAEGLSSAAFRHGPFEMLSPEVFVGVFAGEGHNRELNERLVADVRNAGGKSVLFSSDSADAASRILDVPSCVLPIAEILPVQMMTLALAAVAHREAGKFERATKITAIE